MRLPSKQTYLILVWVAIISGFLLLYFAGSVDANFVGEAFYFSDGTIHMTHPGEPLPDPIMGINMVFWGMVLTVILAFIFTINFLEERQKPKRKKK